MAGSSERAAEIWKVGIGEYKVSQRPHSLKTIGLGSCVGVVIYSPIQKIGGLSHIMLPDSMGFHGDLKPEKFADLAIPMMVEELRQKGSGRNLEAKIAGGASMFSFKNQTPQSQIGQRNVKAVKEILEKLGIPLLGEDTGGSAGRTMWLDMAEMTTWIRMVNQEMMEL